MVHVISIQGSENQRAKLRNGHKIRAKHGRGFNVIVSPGTYNLVHKTFSKSRGMELQLSPEEIAMNKLPSPELQAHIMGKDQPLLLPGVGRGLCNHKKGSGIGDWFKNLGNTIKSGFEDKIVNPIKENIVNPINENIVKPVENVYNKYVPEDIRRDVNTGLRFTSVPGLVGDLTKRLARGEKIQDIGQSYYDDLKHLNNTKNRVIKSSPLLTEAYKKGVMTTAGLGSAAVGSAFGLSPATGALAGVAAAKGADELLKAEGYGLHHAIEAGEKHHYHELKHLSKPIGGALKWSHVTNFFKHAGHAVKAAVPVVQKGATMAHNFLLSHPKLAEKVKQHGSRLAGMLAKAGINYLTGHEHFGDRAEHIGSKIADEQIHKHFGYGLHHAIEAGEKHHYHELKHLSKPIGGALRWSHVTDFFKNAGNAVKAAMPVVVPAVQKGANMVHNFLLNNPKLAEKVKQHGSKLAGVLARMGVNYLTGNEKYGEKAEQMGSKLAEEKIHEHLGYGLHHAILEGEKHHYHELKHLSKPIGGALKWSHVTNFFKHAGHAVKAAVPVVQKGAHMVHNFLLSHPKLAEKVKEHGSRLAGVLARMGTNYLTGNEKYGERAEQMGSKLANEQIHKHLGYGLYSGQGPSGHGLYSGGGGLYGGGSIVPPSPYSSHHMAGGGFDSYASLKAQNIGTALANAKLGHLSNRTFKSMDLQPPIKSYWDQEGQPPSRGYGIKGHHHGVVHHTHHNSHRADDLNLVSGRGRLISHMPPAMQSQPYGANFHMQNMLPPEYHKFNDGTSVMG